MKTLIEFFTKILSLFRIKLLNKKTTIVEINILFLKKTIKRLEIGFSTNITLKSYDWIFIAHMECKYYILLEQHRQGFFFLDFLASPSSISRVGLSPDQYVPSAIWCSTFAVVDPPILLWHLARQPIEYMCAANITLSLFISLQHAHFIVCLLFLLYLRV